MYIRRYITVSPGTSTTTMTDETSRVQGTVKALPSDAHHLLYAADLPANQGCHLHGDLGDLQRGKSRPVSLQRVHLALLRPGNPEFRRRRPFFRLPQSGRRVRQGQEATRRPQKTDLTPP